MGVNFSSAIIWGVQITAEDFKKDFDEDSAEFFSYYGYYHPVDAYNENADIILGVSLASTEYVTTIELLDLYPETNKIKLDSFCKLLPEKYKNKCQLILMRSIW